MRLIFALTLCLSLCGSARAASVHEPKLATTAHSVEHTVSGTRVFLRRGYPNEKTGYARTIRLTLYRSQMGECVSVKVERDDCFTIGGDGHAKVYHGKDMTQAINAFCQEAFIPDRCVEITRDDVTKRMKLSDVRRILDPFFLEDHREFSWCHEANELVVEGKR